MEIQSQTKAQCAFTRIELAIVLACVTLISAMGLTVLGDNRERSERVLCANNLRQIGRAFHMWASDHGGENPFWTHYNDGGSYFQAGSSPPFGNLYNIPGIGRLPAGLRNNAWFQFLFINQELGTPAVLVCPSEQNKLRAQDFSSANSKGLLSPAYQHKATSYFIGFHALQQHPSSMLSGDRNLRSEGQDSSCNANVGSVDYVRSTSFWFPFLHNGAGNLLLNDGRVEELSSAGLTKFLTPDTFNVQTHHFSNPLP
jgi:hypothetical protein